MSNVTQPCTISGLSYPSPITVPSPPTVQESPVGPANNTGSPAPTGDQVGTYVDTLATPTTSPSGSVEVGQYLDYAVNTHYLEDPGVRGSGVCGPFGAPMDVVRVHAGEWFKIVTFFIRRVVNLPQIPSCRTNSSNEIMIGRRVSPATPGDLPDGNIVWTVQGQYTYMMFVGPSEADVLRSGVSPINGISINKGDLPSSVWSQNLIGSPPQPSNSLSGWPSFPV